jgi:vacuolar-type H+-ATPase subunit I/STV1
MKNRFFPDFAGVISDSKAWLKLEIEYAKLTVAEKVTMLLSSLIIGFVCLLLGLVVLICFALALVELLKLVMCPALAFFTVGCLLALLVVILYMVRKPVLLDPIAKMITKIFFDKKH